MAVKRTMHVTSAQVASAARLAERFLPLLASPEALLDELRRQGQKPHVVADEELSFLLGMFVGYVAQQMERDS